MDWTFADNELGCPEVQTLLAAHFQAMRSSSPSDACHVLSASELCDPSIRFWTIRRHGQLHGFGGLKRLSDDHAEIKSMRTAADMLRQGAGRAMLNHLVGEARNAGFARISLETGNSEAFQPAIKLYETSGFIPCGPFGSYLPTPFTLFYTLKL